jgi:hypothetical protein
MENTMLKILTVVFVSFAVLLAGCGPKPTPTPTVPSAGQIELEEQAVYAALLKDLVPAPTIVLMEATSTDPGGVTNTGSTMDYVMKNMHDVDQAAADSFKARNDKSYPLSPDMELGVKYSILTQAQRNEMFSPNQNGWDAFYQNYPDAPGITELSRVGFNTAFDQALVYEGTQSNYLAGAGYFVLLVKVNGAWSVSQKVMSWIS